jgi:hypothetical protein
VGVVRDRHRVVRRPSRDRSGASGFVSGSSH